MNVIAELEEIGGYFAERSDVRDGSYGEQIPNIEMRLELATKDTQRAIAELIVRAEYLCRTGEGMLMFKEALRNAGGNV